MVIVSNLYKDGEKFWSGKEHSHVTVQVSGVNSNCYSMVNLGANFALSFFGLQVRVVFCVGSDFGEPSAGDHDAGGSNRILVQGVEALRIHAPCHGKVS